MQSSSDIECHQIKFNMTNESSAIYLAPKGLKDIVSV